ncbi:phytoene desaturase family protein [Streptomyces sp. NBC_01022]|uniref:phytoene desaturase family protein n=1 Tax=Streptomyces sp. NBC_01022 TaxID=2903723 RepID=UPI002DDB2D96|nr:NAD(P)/FAD-dependent oxidoreductase [Streptomyces sp. NBC_01022]WRZ81614.1 NAD(P)/FAD-dependent oxidoreductase [Streptomyces sp. NBC_01022]
MVDAVVVGSGPNGLAAAVTLAEQGVRVTVLEARQEAGGGMRSGEATLPGLLHDHCSGVHPIGVSSPFFRSFDHERHGLRWAFPEIDLAHPLDGGREAALERSVTGTAARLGPDGPAWRRLFEPLTASFADLATDILAPVLHRPAHPVALARFGLSALWPATVLARRWRTAPARALFAGAAAHTFSRLDRPVSSAIGLVHIAAGHRWGWPVAEGGSQSIARALVSRLAELGGTVETGVRVTSLAQLPSAAAIVLDLAPASAAALLGDRIPARVRRAYGRWRHGPAAFKVDLAVEGGVPWAGEACRRAGTVHLGGTLEEIADAERLVARGRMPERPFVLVGQQYLADQGRAVGDVKPVYAYAHVPAGYRGNATERVLSQIERFAPKFRERVVGMAVTPPEALAQGNANYVGGDILTGANTPWQTLCRPRPALDPYRTGVPGVFLCSAATPPGAGVHGMCGRHAARSALRYLDGRRRTR